MCSVGGLISTLESMVSSDCGAVSLEVVQNYGHYTECRWLGQERLPGRLEKMVKPDRGPQVPTIGKLPSATLRLKTRLSLNRNTDKN